jgi:signal transduction histidine kinase/ActR/RegA family two-component response regulator
MMTSPMELVSIQYALALLIGQDLDMQCMLRKFLPPALRLLNCRSGHIWLLPCKAPLEAEQPPCYSYPSLKTSLRERFPGLAAHLQHPTATWPAIPSPGEIVNADGNFYHFLPIGSSGLLVLVRDSALAPAHIQALTPVLHRLETACQACLQHTYVAVARAAAERAHKEATQAREAAETASKAKSDFLAMISHEIRTPMNGIIGLTDWMLHGELNGTQREHLGMIKSSSHALMEIINEILDFSRIEAGTLTLNRAPFPLRDLFHDIFTPLAVWARKKSLHFHWNIAPDIPEALEGDAGRLRQIMLNLVGNALKFTEIGEVAVNVSLQAPTSAGQCTLLIRVSDTGIGISPDKQSLIFEAFKQADSSISRRYGGTGLGLPISAHLIELMGGALRVESELGQGSTFYFSVPFSLSQRFAPPKDTASPALPKPQRLLNVLLAEDNAINRLIVQRPLAQAGHTVLIAENGQQAVEVWQAQRPHLILMDIQMPVMDGLEAATLIRSRERSEGLPAIPIVALTANSMHADRENCRAAGMEHFISKPMNIRDLLVLLEEIGQTLPL